jgi:hypothetical protein
MEEHNLDDMELRGINFGHEITQVFARPLVPEMGKNVGRRVSPEVRSGRDRGG